MNWNSINFDWNRARAFLVTVEEGSLSAAAKALSMSQPTLGRQVAALEKELGVSLFERVGRGFEITRSGIELYEHVKAMGEAANKLSLTASGRSQSIEGIVSISATNTMSAYILPSLIHKLRQKEPGIQIEIVSTNALSDLRKREADIALRSVEPTHPDLFFKKLKRAHAFLYATPGYLKTIAPIQKPAHLKNANFIGFTSNHEYIEGLKAIGVELTAKNFNIFSDDHIFHWEMVKQGAGIGIMIDEVGAKEPTVRKVLEKLPPVKVDNWIVAHRELKTNRRIRLVFDFLTEALG
ncbi:MAG: LysR family transcriptional regulator [Bdellovibrio sp.]|nr:LysR family transcriptional regulator [Bdellovibrio sp.]